MSLNFQKLAATIHYICDSAKFDQIKLNKALWYSDARAYLTRGSSITGTTYIKKRHGPVSRHHHIAIKYLRQQGLLISGKAHNAGKGKWEKKLDSVGDADKSLFDGKELKIIDDVIKILCDDDSYAAGDRTHGDIWKLATDGEDLPLYTVFAEAPGEITEDHRKLAMADLA